MSTPLSKPYQEFTRSLGIRVDALEAAFNALREGDQEAVNTVRELCEALVLCARECGFPEIQHHAQELLTVEPKRLHPQGNQLVGLMRREVLRTADACCTCVVAGLSREFAQSLQHALHSWQVKVCHVNSHSELLPCLENHAPECIILKRGDDPQEELALMAMIRTAPVSGATPVLALGDHELPVPSTERQALLSSVYFMPGNPSMHWISKWVIECVIQGMSHDERKAIDHDTGLLSHTAFLDVFQDLVARHDMSTEPLALAVIGISHREDNLPQAHHNDKLDSALIALAHLMRSHLRSTDIVGRLRSYEVAALFPGEDDHGGLLAVQKIIDAFEHDANIPALDKPTIHAGVTQVKPRQTLTDALDEADRFLCHARHTTGRTVVCAHPGIREKRKHVVLAMEPSRTRDVLTKALQNEKINLSLVDHGEEAVKMLSERLGVHFAVVDENIDNGSGLEVVRRIRELSSCTRLATMVLEANDSHRQLVKAFEYGAIAYTCRPFSLDGLVRQMRRLITRGLSSTEESARMYRILLVDEDTRSLYLMASALAAHGGFQILLARDPHDFQNRLQEVEPDYLIMAMRATDIMNPPEPAMPLLDAGRDYPCVIVLDRLQKGVRRRLSSRVKLKGILQRPLNALKFAEQVEHCLGLPATPNGQPVIDVNFCHELQRISNMADASKTTPPQAETNVNWVG